MGRLTKEYIVAKKNNDISLYFASSQITNQYLTIKTYGNVTDFFFFFSSWVIKATEG